MKEAELDIVEQPRVSIITKILAFVLVGMLSTTFAELWLGFVFIIGNPLKSLIEMIIFYGAHVVFYYNLAIKYRKSSFTALYWWGALFGLYEAWTTTMVYFGYYNTIGHHGQILGIAIYEYFANVFYWHPINSFFLTLTVVQILFFTAFDNDKEESQLPKTLVMNNKRNKRIWVLYFIYMTGMILSCTYGKEVTLTIYFVGFYLLMLLVYLIVRKQLEKKQLSPLHVLRMGDRSLMFLGGLIAIYYLFSFAVAVGRELVYQPIALFDLIALIYLIFAVRLYPLREEVYDEEEDVVYLEERTTKQKVLLGMIYFFGIVVLGYYLFIFFGIAWVRVYNPAAFFIIFLTYVWVIWMIKKTKDNDEIGPEYFKASKEIDEEDEDEESNEIEGPISRRFILIGIIVPLILSLILRYVVLFIAWILGVFAVELTMVLGIVFLVVMSYKVIKK